MIGALGSLAFAGAAVLAAPPDAPAGRIQERTLASRQYGRDRRFWVYTPPGYDAAAAAREPYPLLIVFDGGEYQEDIELPKILEGLVAQKKAPPSVAVLIDDATGAKRLDDLANHERFAAFVAGEVLELVRAQWAVTRDPSRTVVMGSSAGGLAAAYVAFEHPELFGRVLSQSGAFWRGNEGSNGPPFEWLTGQYAAAPRKNVRFLLEVGSRESAGALGGSAPSILEANRRLHEALVRKGYTVSYAEVPDGVHSPETWRQRLPAAIAELWAR